jgi:acyl carrier protein
MLDRSAIHAKMEMIFQDVLDNSDIALKDQTTAADIEEWDSLAHIQLILAIEQNFKIKFKTTEISGLANVGEMMDLIQKKLS